LQYSLRRPAKSLDRAREQDHLAQADRHIAELRAYIARQRLILTRMLAVGHPSDLAESMLRVFEETLRIFEKHRSLILDQLKD
jgi:hypothetical protein